MPTLAGVVCLLIYAGLAIVSLPTGRVSADGSLGLLELCREHQPDGTAILESSRGGKEVMAIFRGDQVWLLELDSFLKTIKSGDRGTKLFSRANALNAGAIFPQSSLGSKLIIGFSGLNSSHQFYNNILVFKENQLLRYKVTTIKAGQFMSRGEMSATHEGTYDTQYWPNFDSSMSHLRSAYSIRGTRLLVLLQQSNDYAPKAIYQLNRNNLQNPNQIYSGGLEFKIPNQEKALFHHILESGENPSRLTFLYGGQVCLNGKQCVNMADLVNCDSLVEYYISGFSYWVQYNTELTFRLITVGLIAIMLVSSSIAILLTISQLNKVLLLT